MIDCRLCLGRGLFPLGSSGRPLCPVCHGRKRIDDSQLGPNECPRCSGRGLEYGTHDQACATCSGTVRLPNEGDRVVLVKAGNISDARASLDTILAELRGEVAVCDPYYGRSSLARLANLVSCNCIQFLTQKPDDKEKSFIDVRFTEFQKDYSHFIIRRATGPELHDRYVLTADEMILLGHGLKDIGKKDSFILRLHRNALGDMFNGAWQLFRDRWASAAPLAPPEA